MLLAQILEGVVDPAAQVVVDCIGDEHTPGLSEAFQARRDAHSLAEDVLALGDHVAEIDPDAELDALLAATDALHSAIPRCSSTA